MIFPRPIEERGTGRVEQRRDMIRPMTSDVSALSGIVANGHQAIHFVSSAPSKIPYGGFSPVRLQAGCQKRPSSPRGDFDGSTVAFSSVRVLFRSRTCVRRHTRLCRHTPAQRPLAPPRFYCPLASSLTMAASELLPVTAGFFLYADGSATDRSSPIYSTKA